MNAAEKLEAVRKVMRASGLDALIIPSQDPHQSEYVADHWKARQWISGFTGSAGTVVVTLDQAGLWTDSRYFIQAEQELSDSPITFHKQVVPGAPEHLDWIKATLQAGQQVGIDGALVSIEGEEALRAAFQGSDITLVTAHDVVGSAWADRPPLPRDQAFIHEAALAGTSRVHKLEQIMDMMAQAGVQHHLLVGLDDIAWAFNLRGRDVDYNPVFYAYALVQEGDATLFVPPGKLDITVVHELAEEGISVRNYADVGTALAGLEGKLLLDPQQASIALARHIPATCTVVKGIAPSTLLKARKTAAELSHVRIAMEKDGVALLRLCRWLEQTLAAGQSITEHAVGERLAAFRAAQAGYFGESFPAIAGYAGNGAIVHYRPADTGSASLKPEGLFLLDSGGQYADGTTDITRTFALGPYPAAAKVAYTAVLRGHIALAKAQFPKGTAGYQLDPLARQYLWAQGLNYGHGTGHGVGYFLNVHEGPQGISPVASPRSRQPIEPGMITSNEPGYYEAGQWGIRIENLVLCIEGPTTANGVFYAFETLSLFPIEDTLIDWSQLDGAERAWLRDYHQMVWDRLSPRLEADEKAWLQAKCAPYRGAV
jgi:Xaa-Pro aminopeptidase